MRSWYDFFTAEATLKAQIEEGFQKERDSLFNFDKLLAEMQAPTSIEAIDPDTLLWANLNLNHFTIGWDVFEKTPYWRLRDTITIINAKREDGHSTSIPEAALWTVLAKLFGDE